MARRVVAGHPVGVRAFGHGPVPALLMHCSLAHAGAWARMMAHLDDLFSATAFDLPGHGQSAPPPEGADFLGLTCEIAAELAERRSVIVGHSFSALAAIALAEERPELVRALVLIEPVAFKLAEGAAEFDMVRQERDRLEQAWREGGREAAARHFLEVWGTGQSWDTLPEEQRAYVTERIHLIEAGEPATHHDSHGLFAPGRLERISAPVLLLDGGGSPPVIDTIQRALAARLPDCRRETVPGAAHMVPMTHPEETAAAIRAFVQARVVQTGV